jgi:hypothetical protein
MAMKIRINDDLQAAIEFMQSRIQASRLVGVAKGLADLAPVLWGHHPQEPILPMQVLPEPISDSERKELASTV